MKISVVVPVYNEEKVILNSLKKLNFFLSNHFEDYEIIAVNDGSTDNTLKILKSLSFIKLLSHTKNQGKGFAVKKGILSSSGDFVIYTDADLSYSPKDILRALNLAKCKNADCIFGKRINLKKDYPSFRRFASLWFSFFSRIILKLKIKDPQCGFKCFSKNAAKIIFSDLKTYGFAFDSEVAYAAKKHNFSSAEIPLRFSHSQKSSVNVFKNGFSMLFNIFLIRRFADEKI